MFTYVYINKVDCNFISLCVEFKLFWFIYNIAQVRWPQFKNIVFVDGQIFQISQIDKTMIFFVCWHLYKFSECIQIANYIVANRVKTEIARVDLIIRLDHLEFCVIICSDPIRPPALRPPVSFTWPARTEWCVNLHWPPCTPAINHRCCRSVAPPKPWWTEEIRDKCENLFYTWQR